MAGKVFAVIFSCETGSGNSERLSGICFRGRRKGIYGKYHKAVGDSPTCTEDFAGRESSDEKIFLSMLCFLGSRHMFVLYFWGLCQEGHFFEPASASCLYFLFPPWTGAAHNRELSFNKSRQP
ncbi:MAG: hypothetical protein HFG70_02040 [Hungatella sp.]|nr:hypothetical protein [Hungatella sp.]